MLINIVKSVLFAKLDRWLTESGKPSSSKPMSLEAAKLVDCLELQWSMFIYCYQPAGFCSRIKRFTIEDLHSGGKLERFHHIMITNTYNVLFGFVSESTYLHTITVGLKIGWVTIAPLFLHSAIKNPVNLIKIIESCANNHLISEHSSRNVVIRQSDLTYSEENVRFLGYLYDCVTEWPREFVPELINATEKCKFTIKPGEKRNLSFFVFLKRLVCCYVKFSSIKLYITLDLAPMPKCFGLNNKNKEKILVDTTLKICSLCYTLINVYISKSFNRAKIYSDGLLKLTYSCHEKTCKMVKVSLLYYTEDRFIYPTLVWSINNSTEYRIRLREDCRTECKIDVFCNSKLIKNPIKNPARKKTNAFNNGYIDQRICLDLYDKHHPLPNGVEICDGCRILLRS